MAVRRMFQHGQSIWADDEENFLVAFWIEADDPATVAATYAEIADLVWFELD